MTHPKPRRVIAGDPGYILLFPVALPGHAVGGLCLTLCPLNCRYRASESSPFCSAIFNAGGSTAAYIIVIELWDFG